MENDWTEDIERVLEKIRRNCVVLSNEHKSQYFHLKYILQFFRLPVIIISGVNSIVSVGFQPYLNQGAISITTCILALTCSIIGSIELYLAIQKGMENEFASQQSYYLLGVDIFKNLSLAREHRPIPAKEYLDKCYNEYVKLGISINTTTVPVNSTNTIATTNVIGNMSKQYYISLISSTTGSQTINTSTNLLYNTDTDNLQLNNLYATNLPTCSATPVNSNDLINKSYLNSFVGDYTQGWVYDDWITGGVNGSLNWVITNNAADATTLLPPDASGHIGIIRLIRTLQNFTSLQPNSGIRFNSTQNIRVRFLVRPFSNNSSTSYTQVRISLSAYLGNVDYFNVAANYANMASWVFTNYSVNTNSENTNWQCMVNSNTPDAYYTYGLSENSLRNKWVLFEIELNNQKPSFYITVIGETNRTLVYQENTKIIDSSVLLFPHIIIQAGSVSSTTTFDVDYIDIKYNNMSRA